MLDNNLKNNFKSNDENKNINDKPVGELMIEGLESARLYSDKLRQGVKELIENIENDFIGRHIEFISSEKVFPAVMAILNGAEWLMSIYEKCRFFSSAPIHLHEEDFVKFKILNALKSLVNYAEAGDAYNILDVLKSELSPGLEVLNGRIKDLSRLAGLSGSRKGIIIQ